MLDKAGHLGYSEGDEGRRGVQTGRQTDRLLPLLYDGAQQC